MLIFGIRRLLCLKNCQMRPQNSFLRFSLKIQLFSKKLSNKKVFGIKFLIQKAIFIFGVRWPLTGRTVTVERVANTFWNIALLTHFLRQRFFKFNLETTLFRTFLWKICTLFSSHCQNNVGQDVTRHPSSSIWWVGSRRRWDFRDELSVEGSWTLYNFFLISIRILNFAT